MRRANTLFFESAMQGVTFEACMRLAGDISNTATSVTLMLRGPGVIDIAGALTGNDWVFTAAPAATTAWAVGNYWYSVRAVSAAETLEICSGQIEVLQDFASLAAGYDGRTPNEIALAAIVAVLANRATQDQQRYTIGDRELWRTPMGDLLKLKASYTAAVRRERKRASGSKSFGRKIPVRFN